MIDYPSQLFQCPTKDVRTAKTKADFNDDDYAYIVMKVIQMCNVITNNGEDSVAMARFNGCIVRTAGHDLMDYRKGYYGQTIGGSDGCMNFNDPDNDGIVPCLIYNRFLEVYAQVCDKVSLADFLVIAAEAAMIRGHEEYDPDNVFGEGTFGYWTR
jgi:hypothetical protein